MATISAAHRSGLREAAFARSVIVRPGTHLRIGEGATVQDYCILGETSPDRAWRSDSDKIVVIGDGTRIGPWSLIFAGATIGCSVSIGDRSLVGLGTKISDGCRLEYGARIYDNVLLGAHSIVGGFVGDNCRIGARCSVFGALVHRYSHRNPLQWNHVDEEGPTLEDDVVIGWGAVIVGPIRIGRGSIVKPNSVVTSDLPALNGKEGS